MCFPKALIFLTKTSGFWARLGEQIPEKSILSLRHCPNCSNWLCQFLILVFFQTWKRCPNCMRAGVFFLSLHNLRHVKISKKHIISSVFKHMDKQRAISWIIWPTPNLESAHTWLARQDPLPGSKLRSGFILRSSICFLPGRARPRNALVRLAGSYGSR